MGGRGASSKIPTAHPGGGGGGGHTPVVILKEDGRAVTMPYFVVHGTGEELKTFEVK